MLFNSLDFIIFFILIVTSFWIIRAKYRWVLLLIASYFFYMSWEPTYIILILISTLIDYFVCLNLTNSSNRRKKNLGLAISLLQGLGMLFLFKYFDFFQNCLAHLFDLFKLTYTPTQFNVLLPVGISFYTFQTLSYTIDVYRGKIKPERHLGKFALFISFFPQLIAGPIERANDLLPQLQKNDQKLNALQFKEGVILFFWGLFKKVVIADNAGIFVESIYKSSGFQSSESLLFSTYLFAFQLYGDFSGYSDMAVGIAKMLGYELKNNFKQPYLSKNLTSFWRSWHISLSNWFKDYVYIPLGGKNGTKVKQHRNIILTMSLSGIWHGASLNMAIWGLLNGVFLSIEKIFTFIKIKKNKLIIFIQIFATFNIFCFTLIFFRSVTIHQSFEIISKLKDISVYKFYLLTASFKVTNVMIGIYFLLFIEITLKNVITIAKRSLSIRYLFYVTLLLIILLLGSSSGREFIYFQF